VIQSLWYQQKQLKLQSRELRLQRKDLRQNLDEYKEMVKAQKSSDQRLFFTAYLNALDALRESNLNPAKGNVNKPETVLPAIRQGYLNIWLMKVRASMAFLPNKMMTNKSLRNSVPCCIHFGRYFSSATGTAGTTHKHWHHY
jgi:hypothetical protein